MAKKKISKAEKSRSRVAIPEKIKCLLWAKAGGRCEYEGCNKILYRDLLTQTEGNIAYIAHIVADSPDGPRGNDTLSRELETNIDNLMLLCDSHHRLIDKEQVAEHPVERLQKMKAIHEQRIERQTSLSEEKRSLIVTYGANIARFSPSLNYNLLKNAIAPTHYPSEEFTVDLGLKSEYDEKDKLYWQTEADTLERNVRTKISDRIKSRDEKVSHISLFALAPMPLLVKLGTLLPDMYNIEVYQKIREPNSWNWQEPQTGVIDNPFILNTPSQHAGKAVLVIALSAPITERIKKFYDNEEICMWEITMESPQLDFLKYRKQLEYFRDMVRDVFKDIKQNYPNHELHVHMAMPNSCAIEFGRAWMHKVDADLVLYDTYNDKENETITIKHSLL